MIYKTTFKSLHLVFNYTRNYFQASLLLVLLGSPFHIHAQDTWKIGDCIDYAMENNLDLNMKYNSVQSQEVSLKESKANIFPDLNLGSNLNVNFGRNIDGNDNSITYDPTLTNNYWVNSSFTLFQGLVEQR